MNRSRADHEPKRESGPGNKRDRERGWGDQGHHVIASGKPRSDSKETKGIRKKIDNDRINLLQRRVERLEKECEDIHANLSWRSESWSLALVGESEQDVVELRQNEMVTSLGYLFGGNRLDMGMAEGTSTMTKTTERKRDWVIILSGLAILCMVIAALWSAYLVLLEDNPPAIFHRVEVVKDSAYPGEHVEYLVDFEKFTTAAPDRRRFWVNGVSTEVPQPDDPPSNPPGRYEFVVKVDVPEELLPKRDYYIMQSFTWPVNALTERTISHRIGPFHILEDKE